jgi:hypothetical protein
MPTLVKSPGSNQSGVRLENNGFGTVRDSTISTAINGGSAAGISISTANGSASITNTTIAHCSIGINIIAASTNRITHSQVINNGIGVQFAGGTLRSYGDNVYDSGYQLRGWRYFAARPAIAPRLCNSGSPPITHRRVSFHARGHRADLTAGTVRQCSHQD